MINRNFTLETLLDTWFTVQINKEFGIEVTLNYNMQSWLKKEVSQETFYFESLDDLKLSERYETLKQAAVVSFSDTMYYQSFPNLRDRYPFRISVYEN